MRTVAIIQARTSSTRLPGKVLMDLAGEPMLARVVERVRRAAALDDVVVATSTEDTDRPIADLAAARGWPCFRGSLEDVLDRYYQAAKAHRAEAVVRITSDCPLIEPAIVDRVVNTFLQQQPDVDYVSNTIAPRTFPRGLDVEVMRFEALERTWREATDRSCREHVTLYMHRCPESFRLQGVYHEPDLSHLRWTVDTPEDHALVLWIYEHFGHGAFSADDVPVLLSAHPQRLEINCKIQQKAI